MQNVTGILMRNKYFDNPMYWVKLVLSVVVIFLTISNYFWMGVVGMILNWEIIPMVFK